VFIVDGSVVASGPHAELLDTVPSYRALILRGNDA
jgi:hypothetical protein